MSRHRSHQATIASFIDVLVLITGIAVAVTAALIGMLLLGVLL